MNRNKKIFKPTKRFDNDSVNPMEYIGNLVDAMLVLAVGIMLALVINWSLDIKGQDESDSITDTENITAFTQNDLEIDSENTITSDLEKMGTVYFDSETGIYYISQDAN